MASARAIVIGQVIKRGIGRPDTVKVRCLKMSLDRYLLKYFNKRTHHWAIETSVTTDVGDIVMLQRLPERMTTKVGHEVKEIVYKLGSVVDPITGTRCRGQQFIDEAERELQKLKIEGERS
ncbi:28S ribosomal protein S17, mitochondrial-like [Haliotis rubra]|uniref:28S ribosomal protein S17, mitochondrial-like n=1 Tax=Haliotis rubra TaxID=36100 RepID=UPI001EE54403|nr:28S ribosomal protein S17, mitochondrial-like [Haliotis rubra]